MAQLTWRNVDAPQLSTRDLALAGGQITNSFDRLGVALNGWQARKEDGAVDAELGKYLGIGDPDALQKAMASYQGPYAKRVLGELNNLLTTRLNQRADRLQGDKFQEEVYNTQAAGVDVSGVLQAEHSGEQAAIDAAMDKIRSQGTIGQRALGLNSKNFFDAYDGGGDDRREGARDKVDANYKAGSLANDSIRARAAAAESGARVAAINEERAATALGRRAYADAQGMIAQLPAGVSTQDTMLDLMHKGYFKDKPQAYASAFAAAMGDKNFGRDAQLTPTTAQLETATSLPGSGAMLLAPKDVLTGLAGAKTQAGIVETRRVNRLNAENPDMMVVNSIGKFKDAGADDTRAAFEKRGISGDDMEALRVQKGFGYPEMMAILENGNVRDADFWSKRNWKSGGAFEYFHGGDKAASEQADRLDAALRDEGQQAKFNADLAARTAPTQKLTTQLDNLGATIQRKRARGEDISTEYVQYQALQRQLKLIDEGSR
jgi:hypothetical protein